LRAFLCQESEFSKVMSSLVCCLATSCPEPLGSSDPHWRAVLVGWSPVRKNMEQKETRHLQRLEALVRIEAMSLFPGSTLAGRVHLNMDTGPLVRCTLDLEFASKSCHTLLHGMQPQVAGEGSRCIKSSTIVTQYQAVMTRMTSPIVRTARCTGQTAVASIPRPIAVGITCSCLPFAEDASHGVHEAGEWGKHHDAGFYLRRAFAREPSPS
jgi:hypothetical protein